MQKKKKKKNQNNKINRKEKKGEQNNNINNLFSKHNYNDKLNNSENDDDNNNNPNNNKLQKQHQINIPNYINSEFYPIVRNYKNIDPKNLNLINLHGDGNCLYLAISFFIYKTEDKHYLIRNLISDQANKDLGVLPNILIDTEQGQVRIHEYIKIIKIPYRYGGNLEISLSYKLYDFNIAVYKEERDSNDNLINLSFINYINNDNNEIKNLPILTNINNTHYNLIYYNNTPVNINFSTDLISHD